MITRLLTWLFAPQVHVVVVPIVQIPQPSPAQQAPTGFRILVPPPPPPTDFLERVPVTVTENVVLANTEEVQEEGECPICTETRSTMLRLKCCDRSICKECCIHWFTRDDVKCPFCRRDIRSIPSPGHWSVHTSYRLTCHSTKRQMNWKSACEYSLNYFLRVAWRWAQFY